MMKWLMKYQITTKKASFGIGQKKEKAEEPKYSDRSVEVKRTQPSNYYENKTENHYSRTLKKKTV